MRFAISTMLCLLNWTSLALADAVDDYIQNQMRRQHVPGLSLAVVKDGKVVKAEGYGLSNLETQTPATPETVYHLASVGKQFTATAILLLVQDGSLRLDDPISQHLAATPDSWKEIKVRHLLNHTSGVKDYLDELKIRTREPLTPERIMEDVAKHPLNFVPGENIRYTNTGYVLLEMIASHIAGKRYEALLAERVFGPLGMQSTHRAGPDDVIPRRTAGYIWAVDRWQNAPYLNPTLWDHGNGGILSTVLDLAKWDAALYGESVLHAESKREMWTEGKLNDGRGFSYGFGWALDPQRGHRRVWHSGGRPGAAAIFLRYPNDGISVIVLANCNSERGLATDMQRIGVGVARYYVDSLGFPKASEAVAKAVRLSDYTGRYEFSNNSMLTLTEENGKLVERSQTLAGGYWWPTSQTSFGSEDLLVEMIFDQDTRGEVIGMTWKTEREEKKIPRIGPLVHNLAAQPDPTPERTKWVRGLLDAFALGGQAVERAERVTPDARKDFGSAAIADLLGLRSISYIDEKNINHRGIERHGATVSDVLYYRISTAKGERYLLVHLTADGSLTDVDIVDE